MWQKAAGRREGAGGWSSCGGGGALVDVSEVCPFVTTIEYSKIPLEKQALLFVDAPTLAQEGVDRSSSATKHFEFLFLVPVLSFTFYF
jgi:hypothetical protein